MENKIEEQKPEIAVSSQEELAKWETEAGILRDLHIEAIKTAGAVSVLIATADFIKTVEEKYGEDSEKLNHCRLWHLISGSSRGKNDEQYTTFDIKESGLYSVKEFIEQTLLLLPNKKEWKELGAGVKAERDELMRSKGAAAVYEKIEFFLNGLEEKYPLKEKYNSFQFCALWNIITDNEPEQPDYKFFDYPGKDSIQKFIESLSESLPDKK